MHTRNHPLRRAAALFCALALCAGMLPTSAWAQTPAAQQPAASQSLTKDGPVSLNPSQDLDDTASGGGTTPDGDTTQGGGNTPDDDTTQDGGSTPDDDTTTPGGGTTQGGITIPGGVEEALTLTVRYYIAGTNTPIAAPYRAELLPGSSYTVTSPTIEHYTLADPDQATVSGTLREDTVVTVYYRFAEQTAQYTVNYIGRVADKTQETVLATVTGTAPIGQTVKIEDKVFAGYTREATVLTLVVTADGLAQKTVYYTKNQQPSIVFQTGGTYIEPISAPAGADISAQIAAVEEPTKPGWEFDGWDQTLPTEMPAGGLVVEAQWTPGTSSYTVEFYFENANDEGYTLDRTLNETRTATTGSTATVTQADINHADEQLAIADGTYDVYQQGPFYGFDYSHCEDATVKDDGSGVLKLYYDREIWTIKLMANLTGTSSYGSSSTTRWGEFKQFDLKVWKEFSGKYGAK